MDIFDEIQASPRRKTGDIFDDMHPSKEPTKRRLITKPLVGQGVYIPQFPSGNGVAPRSDFTERLSTITGRTTEDLSSPPESMRNLSPAGAIGDPLAKAGMEVLNAPRQLLAGAGKNIAHMAASMADLGAIGIDVMIDLGVKELPINTDGLEELRDFFEEQADTAVATAPESEGFFGFVGESGMAVTPTAIALRIEASRKFVLAFFGAIGAGSSTREQKEAGVEDTTDIAIMAIGAGLIEVISESLGIEVLGRLLPVAASNVMKAMRKGDIESATKAVLSVLGVGGAGGVEEVIAEGLNNVAASGGIGPVPGYDPDRPVTQGLVKAGAAGFVGSLFLTGGSIARQSRADVEGKKKAEELQGLRVDAEIEGEREEKTSTLQEKITAQRGERRVEREQGDVTRAQRRKDREGKKAKISKAQAAKLTEARDRVRARMEKQQQNRREFGLPTPDGRLVDGTPTFLDQERAQRYADIKGMTVMPVGPAGTEETIYVAIPRTEDPDVAVDEVIESLEAEVEAFDEAEAEKIASPEEVVEPEVTDTKEADDAQGKRILDESQQQEEQEEVTADEPDQPVGDREGAEATEEQGEVEAKPEAVTAIPITGAMLAGEGAPSAEDVLAFVKKLRREEPGLTGLVVEEDGRLRAVGTEGEFLFEPVKFGFQPGTLAPGTELAFDFDSFREFDAEVKRIRALPRAEAEAEFPGSTAGFTSKQKRLPLLRAQQLAADKLDPGIDVTPRHDRSGRTRSIAQRLLDTLDTIEGDARERLRKAAIPRGKGAGATILPQMLVDAAIVGAAKILKGTITFGKWAVEMRKDLGPMVDKHLKDIWKRSRQLVADIEAGTVDPDIDSKVKAAVASPLRGANRALQAGLRAIQDQIPRIKAQIRAEVTGKLSERQGKIDDIRLTIRNLVEEVLPIAYRGRFLSNVTKAKSRGDLLRAADKVEREAYRLSGVFAARTIQQQTGRRAMGRNHTRAADRPGMTAARLEMKGLLGQLKRTGRGRVSTPDIVAASERLTKIAVHVNQILRLRALEHEQFAAGETSNVAGHRAKMLKDIKATNRKVVEPRTDDGGKVIESRDVTKTRKFMIGLSDAWNLAELIEGHDNNGVGVALLVTEARKSERNKLRENQERLVQLDAMSQRAGYGDFRDFLDKTSGSGGRGVVERITVTLGGVEQSISVGDALAIVAHDESTVALWELGMKTRFDHAREVDGFQITEADVNAIRSKLSNDQLRIVQAGKDIMEDMKEDMFRAKWEIDGTEPIDQIGYFPRRRKRETESAGIPKGWKQVWEKFAENLPQLKPREGGTKQDLVLVDFGTALWQHIDAATTIIHVAKHTRRVHAVFEDPAIKTAIEARWSSSMIRALQIHMSAQSLVNESVTTEAARTINKIKSNMASTFLSLSAGTLVRQLGGLPRIMAATSPQDYAAGFVATISLSMSDLVDNGPYFHERYRGNIAGRFSPGQADTTASLERSKKAKALKLMAKNLAKGDIKAALANAQNAALTPLQLLNWMDAFNAKFAVGIKLHESKRIHKDWSDEQHTEWAYFEAESLVRDTQNSSSSLDMTTFAIQGRDNIAGMVMLFQSDVMKSHNRVARGMRRGKVEGSKQIIAESSNIIWSQAAGGMQKFTYAAMLIALGFGGDDEEKWERIAKRAFRVDRMLLGAATDAVSVVDPVIANRLMDSAIFLQAPLTDTPITDKIEDINQSYKNLILAGRHSVEGDWEKAGEKLRSALLNGLNDILSVLGINPFAPMIRSFQSSADALAEDNDQSSRKGRGRRGGRNDDGRSGR